MTEAEETAYQERRHERRRHHRLWIIICLGVIAGAFAVMALSASVVVVRSANERQEICTAAAKERDVLRDVLIFARDTTASRIDLDAAERTAVRIFYDGALARAPEVECNNGSIERR